MKYINPESTKARRPKPEKKIRAYSTEYAAEYKRKWTKEHPHACTVQGCLREVLSGNMCNKHKKDYNARNVKAKYNRKLLTLSHYGAKGKLQCNWEGCTIVDVDMLSIDHINNDGNVARSAGYDGCGEALYRKLIREDFPEGFQTLCHNHQWKKEIVRRRKIFEENQKSLES